MTNDLMTDDRMRIEREVPVTEFALLRHAQTRWNSEERIQGQQDAPLTSFGRQQAENWATGLAKYRWDCLVSSDLGRATHTVRILNETLGLPHLVEPRLREQDWGEWSGLRFEEIDTAEFREQQRLGWDFRPLGGESRLEVLDRSRQALVDVAQTWNSARILVVTHGGVMRCLLYRLHGRGFLPEDPPLIEPYRLHWLDYDGSGFSIRRMNERIDS
jgi:probable phosphoglycerate mutase